MYAFALLAAFFCASVWASDGERLQTESTPRDIHLENGVDVRLASQSAGTFYGDHAILEQGSARIGNFGGGYTVIARQLQIEAEDPGAQAVIRLGSKTVDIASLGGALNVTGGALSTRIGSGSKMSFQQSGAAPADQTQPAQTAATTAKHGPSEKKTLLWVIGITAAAALAIGLTAAAQGKSPF